MNPNHYLADSGIGLPEHIRHLKGAGELQHAIRLIDEQLALELPDCMRDNLIAQREIMRRLPAQFCVSVDEALARIRTQIADFTAEELQHYMDNGRICWHYIEGKQMVLESFFDTLIKESEIAARLPQEALAPSDLAKTGSMYRLERLSRSRTIMAETGSHGAVIRLRHTLQIRDEAFVPGETYRVHIPLPITCLQQSDIVLHDHTGGTVSVAPEDAPARSIFWEEKMTENHPFFVEYSYRHVAPYTDPATIHADAVQPDFFTGEQAPHIVFTPYIRALCAELTGGLTSPVEKVRAIYDYITSHVKYAFMPEYFVMPQIADTCLRTLRGDCGVQALAFITLCRCAGIPARWQSGLVADPESVGNHDWAMFYVAPHGWMFADCSFGGSAYRSGDEARRRHYFGNLDLYRCVTTSEFMADLTPPSHFWRQDPYDNQAGEIEDSTHGLMLSEFDHKMTCISLEELAQEGEAHSSSPR